MAFYWVLPIIAAGTWFITLAVMLLYWIAKGQPFLGCMRPGQTIPYISHIGSYRLKLLFVFGTTVAMMVFEVTVVILVDRLLRYSYRRHNRGTAVTERYLAILIAILNAGAALGGIFLSIFDKASYKRAHKWLFYLFIIGGTASAILLVIDYSLLDIRKKSLLLEVSYFLKIGVLALGVAATTAFGVYTVRSKRDRAAIAEWSIALVFIIYMATFVLDLLDFPDTRVPRKNRNG